MAKNKYIKHAKESMKLGITSMVGMGAMGALGKVPGMPVQAGNVTQAAGAGLTLANVGKTAEIGMDIMPGSRKKKSGNKYIDKII